MMIIKGLGSSSSWLGNGIGFLRVLLVQVPLFLFAVGTHFVFLKLVTVYIVKAVAVITEVGLGVP